MLDRNEIYYIYSDGKNRYFGICLDKHLSITENSWVTRIYNDKTKNPNYLFFSDLKECKKYAKENNFKRYRLDGPKKTTEGNL